MRESRPVLELDVRGVSSKGVQRATVAVHDRVVAILVVLLALAIVGVVASRYIASSSAVSSAARNGLDEP